MFCIGKQEAEQALYRTMEYPMTDRPDKHKLSRGRLVLVLLSRFVKLRSVVAEEKSIMYQPFRSQGGHIC